MVHGAPATEAVVALLCLDVTLVARFIAPCPLTLRLNRFDSDD